MADLEGRMKGIENATGGGGGGRGGKGGGRPVFVHAAPGWSRERAMAYHLRTQGPIPAGAKIMIIQHSFLSPLSFWPEDEVDADERSATSSTSRDSR